MKNKIIILILALFVASRFLLFGMVYHQDEYKWAMLANPQFHLNLTSDHPPLVGILYEVTGFAFGFNHLRLLPIFISLLNLILVYFIAKKLYGKVAGIWAATTLFFSVYFFVASTQIDIDGALLPFFGLLLFFAYIQIDFKQIWSRSNRAWFIIFLLAIIGGFLIKLSFALFVAALGTEYLLSYRPKTKELLKTTFWVCLSALISGLLSFVLSKIFNVNHPAQFVENATHFGFFNINKNYFQELFLTAKALILASPLIISGYLVGVLSKQNIIKYRFWLIYGIYNLLFYYIVFDFSNRTLERYLMFMIIPGAIMLGSYLAEQYKAFAFSDIANKFIFCLTASTLACLCVLSMNYSILPLNPKSAYIHALVSLHLNFLLPITGGSGPVGFYMLVSFIVCFFVFAALAFGLHLYFKKSKPAVSIIFLTLFLSLGIVYNFVADAELAYGSMYGSVNAVVARTVAFVNSQDSISKVITYYDIAGYELNLSGKYYKRFYTDPMFADSNVGKFSDYRGYYMVVDFPEIDKNSVYWKYLNTCKTVYSTKDKNIFGYVFDCRAGDQSLFNADKN